MSLESSLRNLGLLHDVVTAIGSLVPITSMKRGFFT